jgi:hypothetical protein
MANGNFTLICNWKMENGKQYVYINHFTLGEKTAACEKNHTPSLPGYFPLLIFTMSFYFSIFQLHFIKQLIINRGVCVVFKW